MKSYRGCPDHAPGIYASHHGVCNRVWETGWPDGARRFNSPAGLVFSITGRPAQRTIGADSGIAFYVIEHIREAF